MVSCLYYIAGAFYALNDLVGLKRFLEDYRVLLQDYKPKPEALPPIDSSDFGLVYSQSQVPKMSLALSKYYLWGENAAVLPLWQKAHPKIQFEWLQISLKNLTELTPYLIQATICYLPADLPANEKDAVIFALIEGVDIQTYPLKV